MWQVWTSTAPTSGPALGKSRWHYSVKGDLVAGVGGWEHRFPLEKGKMENLV